MFLKPVYIFILVGFYSLSGVCGFVSFDLGYEHFATSEMQDNNAKFAGPSFQFEYGAQMRTAIFTFYLKKSDLKAKFLHDDSSYTVKGSQFSYGLKASFSLGRKNYLVFGYNISKTASNFSSLTDYEAAGLRKAYNLEDTQSSSGLILGLGRNFYKKRSTSLFGEYNMVNHSNIDGQTHLILFGLRYKVNFRI